MPSNPLTDPQWAANITETVDRYVGLVRDNVTTKAVRAVRAVVFGALLAVAGLVLAVIGGIFGMRLLQRIVRAVGRVDHNTSVWVSYLVIAALLFGLGAVLMRKRHARA